MIGNDNYVLLRLKYRDSITDAIDDLAPPERIAEVLRGFQKYLYNLSAA